MPVMFVVKRVHLVSQNVTFRQITWKESISPAATVRRHSVPGIACRCIIRGIIKEKENLNNYRNNHIFLGDEINIQLNIFINQGSELG